MIRTLLLIFVLAFSSCLERPEAGDFTIGLSKSQILSDHGEPASRQELVKDTEFIFGPIETFWSVLSMGDRIETWSYPVEGGTVELYFVNKSEEVAETGFAADGAVY